MKLNGIVCVGYAIAADGFTALLQSTNREQILAINTTALNITADDDKVVESFHGYGKAIKINEDLSLGRFTVVFPPLTEEAQRLSNAEATIALLTEQNKTLSSKLAASIQTNANLEECLIEMAGVVYA